MGSTWGSGWWEIDAQTYLQLVMGVLEAGILMTGIGEHRSQINGLLKKVEENAGGNYKEGINFRERQKRVSAHVSTLQKSTQKL